MEISLLSFYCHPEFLEKVLVHADKMQNVFAAPQKNDLFIFCQKVISLLYKTNLCRLIL